MTQWQTVALPVIAVAAVAGILLRPWRMPEWIWSVAGAASLVAVGAISPHDAAAGLGRGASVYAFLLGIVLLAGIGGRERVFEWIAVQTLRLSGASPRRLFGLVYVAGIAVTAFFSNDTAAVVLTSAVLGVLARTDADARPYVFACVFAANAASFVLPVSNPANLVIYGRALPPLAPWLGVFGLPAAGAIAVTYVGLRLAFARHLNGELRIDAAPVVRDARMHVAFVTLGLAAILLVAAAIYGWDVGYAAFAAGCGALLVVGIIDRHAAKDVLEHLAWQIVPLVAGLFVIVEGLDRAGALALARSLLSWASSTTAPWGSLWLAAIVAAACNAFNNLPVGLLAGHAVAGPSVKAAVEHATLISVDLSPNISVTGSLATLLWLMVLRRHAIDVGAWTFFRYGIAVTIPALLVSVLLASLAQGTGR